MFCMRCGSDVLAMATACTSCGTAVPQANGAHRVVGTKVKDASEDALKALKVLAVNPVGGLSEAYESLGRQRSLGVGLVFGAVFVLAMVFTFTMHLAKADLTPNLKGIASMLLIGVVPFVAIAGASLIARKLFRGEGGSIESDVLMSGASLIPIGIAAVTTVILGVANLEVIMLVAVFSVCYALNILFVGSSRLSRIPEALVTPAVAVTLVFTLWLAKVIIASAVGSVAGELLGFLFS
jgi:hypothetical protein